LDPPITTPLASQPRFPESSTVIRKDNRWGVSKMQHLIRYVQRKWKFILAMSILLVLNYFAWSFPWENQNIETEQDDQADSIPTNIT
jgi:hypothetical protein